MLSIIQSQSESCLLLDFSFENGCSIYVGRPQKYKIFKLFIVQFHNNQNILTRKLFREAEMKGSKMIFSYFQQIEQNKTLNHCRIEKQISRYKTKRGYLWGIIRRNLLEQLNCTFLNVNIFRLNIIIIVEINTVKGHTRTSSLVYNRWSFIYQTEMCRHKIVWVFKILLIRVIIPWCLGMWVCFCGLELSGNLEGNGKEIERKGS